VAGGTPKDMRRAHKKAAIVIEQPPELELLRGGPPKCKPLVPQSASFPISPYQEKVEICSIGEEAESAALRMAAAAEGATAPTQPVSFTAFTIFDEVLRQPPPLARIRAKHTPPKAALPQLDLPGVIENAQIKASRFMAVGMEDSDYEHDHQDGHNDDDDDDHAQMEQSMSVPVNDVMQSQTAYPHMHMSGDDKENATQDASQLAAMLNHISIGNENVYQPAYFTFAANSNNNICNNQNAYVQTHLAMMQGAMMIANSNANTNTNAAISTQIDPVVADPDRERKLAERAKREAAKVRKAQKEAELAAERQRLAKEELARREKGRDAICNAVKNVQEDVLFSDIGVEATVSWQLMSVVREWLYVYVYNMYIRVYVYVCVLGYWCGGDCGVAVDVRSP
jgi:hypothetical protein